jgi:hypothetical protein
LRRDTYVAYDRAAAQQTRFFGADVKGAAMQKKLESIGRPGGKAYTVPIGGKMSGAGSVNALITVAVGGYIFMQNPGVQGAKDAAAGMVEGALCGLNGGGAARPLAEMQPTD